MSTRSDSKVQNTYSSLLTFIRAQVSALKKLYEELRNMPQNLNNTRQQFKTLQDILFFLEQRVNFQLRGVSEEDLHDFVVQFYDGKLSQLKLQRDRTNKENQTLKKRLHELQTYLDAIDLLANKQNNSLGSLQAYQTRSSIEFLISDQVLRLRKQLQHCKKVGEDNQLFITQQNHTMNSLRIQISRLQFCLNQTRQKHTQRIKELDNFHNTLISQTQSSLRYFDIQTKAVHKQLNDLQLKNLELLEQKAKTEQNYFLKCQQSKDLERRIYDLSLELVRRQKDTNTLERAHCQSQQSMKILQAEISALQQKNQLAVVQCQQRYQLQVRTIEALELKLEQSREYVSSLYQNYTHLSAVVAQQQSSLKTLQEQLLEQQSTLEQKSKEILILERENYALKQENVSLTRKCQEFQGSCIIQQEKTKRQERAQFQLELNKIRQDLAIEVQQLMGLNQKLQEKVKTLHIEKKQMEQNAERFGAKQQYHKILKQELSRVKQQHQTHISQTNTLKKSLQHLNSKNQMLQAANIALQQHMSKMQHQIKECRELDSSHMLSSQKLIGLQSKLLQSDKNTKEMSSQIEKLLHDNKNLRQRFNRQNIQINDKNVARKQMQKELSQELNRRDFQIRQLQNKVSILQQELRQSDKSNSMEKNRLSVKLMQLESLLSYRNRFSRTSRFRFSAAD